MCTRPEVLTNLGESSSPVHFRIALFLLTGDALCVLVHTDGTKLYATRDFRNRFADTNNSELACSLVYPQLHFFDSLAFADAGAAGAGRFLDTAVGATTGFGLGT